MRWYEDYLNTLTRAGIRGFRTPFGRVAGVDVQKTRVRNLHVSSFIEGFLLSRCASTSSIIPLRFVWKRYKLYQNICSLRKNLYQIIMNLNKTMKKVYSKILRLTVSHQVGCILKTYWSINSINSISQWNDNIQLLFFKFPKNSGNQQPRVSLKLFAKTLCKTCDAFSCKGNNIDIAVFSNNLNIRKILFKLEMV